MQKNTTKFSMQPLENYPPMPLFVPGYAHAGHRQIDRRTDILSKIDARLLAFSVSLRPG